MNARSSEGSAGVRASRGIAIAGIAQWCSRRRYIGGVDWFVRTIWKLFRSSLS